ncbi:MAG: NHLP family bacteriocin export ABC transporter peptidase/permease/ATPase subunit [Rhodocyclaceae bacterium]|nr:NHLP family bacteriocin export ABC transporter peptidase/permease/ATPase subunit [Rhodocyclaceae bacterium]
MTAAAAAAAPPGGPGAAPQPQSAPAAVAQPLTARVKTPTVLQMEAVECGAASLAMILGYFGRWVTLEELRTRCGVSRDGSNASNILKAARSYGLEAKGYRKEVGQLQGMRMPLIIFWNFNHFVVLEGFEKGYAHINDPGGGRRAVDMDEFDEAYTGVALWFDKGPDFQPGGERPSAWRSVRRRFRGLGTALNYLLLTGVALIVPGLVIPILGSTFIDKVLVAGSTGWVQILTIGVLVTLLLRTGLFWLQQHYLLKLRTRISVDTTQRFFWHVLNLPAMFYSQRSAGDISQRIRINDTVARLVSEDLVGSLLACVQAVFFCALMFLYDGLLTLVVILQVVANVLLMRWISERSLAASQKLAIDGGKVYGATLNGLEMLETLKASGNESNFFARWAGYETRYINSELAMSRIGLFTGALPAVLAAASAALIVGVGGLRIMDGALSIGMLVAFQSLAASFAEPVERLVALYRKLLEAAGDINRVDDVLNNPTDPFSGERTLAAAPDSGRPKLSGALELRGVTFGYNPAAAPLLRDFDLSLRPGDRVAVVGPSGCGKSTVSRLVIGLFQPWSGEILFDGRRREDIDRVTLANSIAYVDQDINLFEGSFRDNITMWDRSVPMDAVVQAARDACIHDFILSRPDGYESRIRDGGTDMSGGQRQRIEIARALVNEPSILVLDEATSALDTATEEMVDRNLRRRGCTCLIVAHRLSTVRDADRIFVLSDGVVVEQGRHEELAALQGGLYAGLFSAH